MDVRWKASRGGRWRGWRRTPGPGTCVNSRMPSPAPASRRRQLTLEEVRREHIERVLETCQGNRLRAAQMLGIGRTSLYRFLKRSARGVRQRGVGSAAAGTREEKSG